MCSTTAITNLFMHIIYNTDTTTAKMSPSSLTFHYMKISINHNLRFRVANESTFPPLINSLLPPFTSITLHHHNHQHHPLSTHTHAHIHECMCARCHATGKEVLKTSLESNKGQSLNVVIWTRTESTIIKRVSIVIQHHYCHQHHATPRELAPKTYLSLTTATITVTKRHHHQYQHPHLSINTTPTADGEAITLFTTTKRTIHEREVRKTEEGDLERTIPKERGRCWEQRRYCERELEIKRGWESKRESERLGNGRLKHRGRGDRSRLEGKGDRAGKEYIHYTHIDTHIQRRGRIEGKGEKRKLKKSSRKKIKKNKNKKTRHQFLKKQKEYTYD